MKKILAILLLGSLTTHAQFFIEPPIVGGDALSVGPGTAGFGFTVGAAPISVAALGIWDDSGTGLFNSHAVGIWDASQTLIASVVVAPAASVDIGGFWYANLATPLVLAAGQHYTLGARYGDSDFDFARGNVPTVTTDPRITLGAPVLSTGVGFEFPDIELPQAAAGFFGPNIAFAPVPEPASALFTALLLALGVGATNLAKAKPAPKELAHAKRRQPLEEAQQPPAANRPSVTPGNVNGNRPTVPPGLANYASP